MTYVPEAYWPHNTCLYVTDFKGNDPLFVAYLLRTMPLAEMNSGAAQPSLNRNFLYPLPVRVPDRKTQKRVASILGAYDDLIEFNRRRVTVLEEMARGLFEEWFVRFRFPGHEAVAIIGTKDGALPEGWEVDKLGGVLTQRRDTTKAGDHLSSRRYVPVECIGRRTLALTEQRSWTEAQSSLQLFDEGDILFGAMRAYFHKVAPAPFPGVTRSTCFVLQPKAPHLFSFSLLLLFRDETVAFAAANSKGSTIPYAQWAGVLDRMKIARPPTALLKNFENLVRPMINLLIGLARSNESLTASRDLLLPRLISGQLSVATAERELEAVA